MGKLTIVAQMGARLYNRVETYQLVSVNSVKALTSAVYSPGSLRIFLFRSHTIYHTGKLGAKAPQTEPFVVILFVRFINEKCEMFTAENT